MRLCERSTRKRSQGDDLSLGLFTINYQPLAVDAEVIAENNRSIEQQLASLRFFDLRRNAPTYAGIILFAKDPRQWLPDNFVQDVRYAGCDMSGEVLWERRFGGDLLTMLHELDVFASGLPNTRPTEGTLMRETLAGDYPVVALREFLFNAVTHHALTHRLLFGSSTLMTVWRFKVRAPFTALLTRRTFQIKRVIATLSLPKR